VSREATREILGAQLSNFQGMEPVQWFSFSELQAATRNFQESLLIGKGGLGKVFLGTLPNKLHVAVKEITSVSKPGVVEVSRIFLFVCLFVSLFYHIFKLSLGTLQLVVHVTNYRSFLPYVFFLLSWAQIRSGISMG
jgi:hypothetical protein